MDQQKQQIVERLKQANNILVTVRSNPSVDQLAACIGMTLALNKMDKHATAVFSGEVPSTIEFLQPEKTIEKNTNSLQDFIIALDKSKADKLRYKVEDTMVKIFITPYRTSINQNDLQFSQGDFNVDVVLALGVHMQADLDQAITAHGRILHDATVMTINVQPGGELGSINWLDAAASSLSELIVELTDSLDQTLLDGQISTALLTGIVAETDRFSNQKTSPRTMSLSAELMSAGANQQLVASKLQEPAPAPKPIATTPVAAKPQDQPTPSQPEPPKPDDGTIEIAHDESPTADFGSASTPAAVLPPVAPDHQPVSESMLEPFDEAAKAPQIHIDDQGQLRPLSNATSSTTPLSSVQDVLGTNSADQLPPRPTIPSIIHDDNSHILTEPPTFDSTAGTSSDSADEEEKPTNALNIPNVGILNRQPLKPTVTSEAETTQPSSARPDSPQVQKTTNTLSDLERAVHSSHLDQPTPPASSATMPSPVSAAPAPNPPLTTNSSSLDTDAARQAVAQAISAQPNNGPLPPEASLNALPLGGELHPSIPADSPQTSVSSTPANPNTQPPSTLPSINDIGAPPESPPPMLPPL